MIRAELLLRWEAREPSQSDDASKLTRFVNGLTDFDPIYQSWLQSPKTKKQALPVPLREAQARQLLIDTMVQYDTGEPWPEIGSDISGGHAGVPPYDFQESSYADTRCRIGNYSGYSGSAPNHIFMRLSQLRASTKRPWSASELRPLMRFARDVWTPVEMCAIFSYFVSNLPKTPDPSWAAGIRALKPWIGWITYLPPDLASRAQYPGDVEVESFDDGAALVTLCEKPFEKTDAEGMAKLRALEAALRPIQS